MNGKVVFTLDFVTGQLRLALVAVLAYGGGKGWFTPTDATFITAIAGALGPLLIPWAWSIAVNSGKVSVPSGSAAAAVAAVEKTDAVSASQGASVAVQQAAKAAAVLFIAIMACLFAGEARAQVKLVKPTGNIAADIAAATGRVPATSSDPLQNIIGALDAKLLPDLQYAKTMADASGSKVTAPCYGAWIDLINVRQKAVSATDGTPLPFPDPGIISRFEQIVELRNALQPDSNFMIACSPVASMVKKDIVGFIGLVISGGAGLATLVPGL